MGQGNLGEFLGTYLTGDELRVNLTIIFNLVVALFLGLMVGYERSYHGRAAGMRTYGLVCTTSAALTILAGYPDYWFGGDVSMPSNADPTRVVQGIVTGIGFLGAGVIMRLGFNISGLTTAASIWSSAAIGVLVGVGFYVAATMLALLSIFCMVGVSRLEFWLPSKQAIAVVVRFKSDASPDLEDLRHTVRQRGYALAMGTLAVDRKNGQTEWSFVIVAQGRESPRALADLSESLGRRPGVDGFMLSRARN